MTVSTQNRFNFRHIAIASLAALAVSASGLSAHAASSSSEPVSVTVTLPNIATAQDRKTAIANFRKEAMDACEVRGTRGLTAIRLQTLCADDLVEVFTAKIDTSIAMAARKEAEDTSDT